MAKKSTNPAPKTGDLTRAFFRENAKTMAVQIGEKPFEADVKEFSTGSLGWFGNGKLTLLVGGKEVKCQIGLNITIIGSKELSH